MSYRCFVSTLLAASSLTHVAVADAPPGRYTYPTSDTVYDTRTKLTWQRAVDVDAELWPDAKNYCASLPSLGTAWRLPTRAELLTLVDPTRSNPAIDPTAFPNTPAQAFWSSSVYVGSSSPYGSGSGGAWSVSFMDGSSGYREATFNAARVRCVR